LNFWNHLKKTEVDVLNGWIKWTFGYNELNSKYKSRDSRSPPPNILAKIFFI